MATHKKKPPRRVRPVSADEHDLWARVMDDVKPLVKSATDRDPPPGPEDDDQPAAPPPTEKPSAKPRRRRIVRAEAPPPPKTLPALSPGRAAGMDKRSAQRLRRGKAIIDARMDLHGMTQGQASRGLEAFLARSAAAGHRTVLVITGKGLVREGTGVLKAAVPGWLNESPNRERILGFFPAQPRDGGDGALYVRLKRKRNGP